MTQIQAYLTFNGNCREAMIFYQHCFGGKLSFQTLADTPGAHCMPDMMKENILHASLIQNSFVLMGSDMIGPRGLVRGNAISLMIQCSDLQELENVYTILSTEGQIIQPLDYRLTERSAGKLKDKFGIVWMLLPIV